MARIFVTPDGERSIYLQPGATCEHAQGLSRRQPWADGPLEQRPRYSW